MADTLLSGLLTINGTDAYTEWGVFLTEDKPGDMENLKQILAPAGLKAQTGVNISTEAGRRYSDSLDLQQDERDVTLYFAQYALSRQEWFDNYRSFLTALKAGYDETHKGWLRLGLPTLGITMTLFMTGVTQVTPLTYLWQTGVQAAKYKIRFKEPEPSF